ncbi:MAG: 4-hydroxythreonine-4-phosphate dehydrogenase PdxA [Candidatus Omnitrophota bacterium]|nr:4-hydroxythreonine-4-phosphate dehydrogenase PdxA [Candidatus Omnitrophota bacterium]
MSLKTNLISKSTRIKVGLTIGDPSGIGPVIVLKAINKLSGLADFVVIGDSWVLSRIPEIRNQKPEARFVDSNNVNHKKFSFGIIKAEYGRASIEYLDKALELLSNKEIDCLVTAPISKEAIAGAGFKYGGHTEYFLKKTGSAGVVMMLLNDKLKFSLVTRHIPLNKVSRALNKAGLRENILITYKSLVDFFGIKKPRIVLCGVNPHASDHGIIGNEELLILKPALKKIKRSIDGQIDGPFSSDVAILEASRGKYDCVIAMYHDQALIPLKLTGFDSGVNLTLGLPFVRTSPLHGTAFDIAKSPQLADPSSLIAAIKLAVKCASQLKRA